MVLSLKNTSYKSISIYRISCYAKRGIWWVFIRVIVLGIYTEHFPREFEKLRQDLLEDIMPILHEEYLKWRNNQ